MLNKAFEIPSILQAPYPFRTNYFYNNLSQTHTPPTAILLSVDTFSCSPFIFILNIL